MNDACETPTAGALTDPRLDERGQIIGDVPCRQCQYNLRGLAGDGRCPECGGSIAFSLRDDLLRHSNPDWVARLARGSRLVVWGLTLILGILILALVAALLVGSWATPAAAAATRAVSLGAVAVVALAGMIMIYAGLWLLTTPDPSGLGENRYAASRKIVRFAVLVYICNFLFQKIVGLVGLWSARVGGLFTVAGIIDLLAGLIGLLAALAYFDYLSKLAMRIPDTSLARLGRYLFRASAGGILLAFLVIPVTAAVPPMWASVGLVYVIAVPILILMAVYLQTRMAAACRQQAELARKLWRGEAAETTHPAPQ